MECAICLNTIITSCVGSCTHHFCSDCLLKWCKTNNVCPKCKCIIREIKADPEFDVVSSGCRDIGSSNYTSGNIGLFGLYSKIGREIIVDFPINTNAGITLRNCNGPGVAITNLDYNGRARICGLKIADVILSVNNVPCINHKQTIAIFDECMFSNKSVKCVVVPGMRMGMGLGSKKNNCQYERL